MTKPELTDPYGELEYAVGKGFASGDLCPNCGTKMKFEEGEPQTMEEPGFKDAIFCAGCKFIAYNIDYSRECSEDCEGCPSCYEDPSDYQGMGWVGKDGRP